MRNSMSFSTVNLAELVASTESQKKVTASNGKNAQYYKKQLESHVDELASSDNRDVRIAVASSQFASSSVLKDMLAIETDTEIIGVLLNHSNLSKTVKVKYVKENKELIQSIIESSDAAEIEASLS